MPHGIGKFMYSEQNIESEYEGEVANGTPHGKGQMIFKNGDIYTGYFNNGMRHGRGRHVYSNQDQYPV